MKITPSFDGLDVSTLPSGFQTSLIAAIKYLTDHLTNDININLHVGWGDVRGVALGTLFAGHAYDSNTVSYDNLVAALQAHASSADDQAAVAALPPVNPLPEGNTIRISQVEAKVLGLSNLDSVDIWIGFNKTTNWDFDTSNGVAPTGIDFFATAINEITNAMGRDVPAVATIGQFTPWNLWDYSGKPTAAGDLHQFTTSAFPSYFSLDHGTTNLQDFWTGGGDQGDWNPKNGPDAFNAIIKEGSVHPVSDVDLRAMDVLGFDLGTTPPPGGQPTTIETKMWKEMNGADPTDAQLLAWAGIHTEQAAFAQKIGVGSVNNAVFEAFGLGFSDQSKFRSEFGTNKFGLSDNAGLIKAMWNDAFNKASVKDPTDTQIAFVQEQLDFHTTIYDQSNAFGHDPAAIANLARGAVYGVVIGIADDLGQHDYLI